MRRLVFIVEGDTEIILVEKSIIPYLYGLGLSNSMSCQTITTNRKQHKKGGVVSYGSFKNEVKRTLAQPNVIVTTLIDFFKLPTDFPGYTTDSTCISEIERSIFENIGCNPFFIPYIQRHELESLMFSSNEGFDLVVDDSKAMEQLNEIIEKYPNPEDINNTPQTAPSKRLETIFRYDKTQDGELIFEMLGIDLILEKCPRFSDWINSVVALLRSQNS